MARRLNFAELELARGDSLRAFFRWYLHPRKLLVDGLAHASVGFAALLPIALVAAFPWWAGAAAAGLAAIPREVSQWPPRRMPTFGRAYFDPPLDVLLFAVGGALAALVPPL